MHHLTGWNLELSILGHLTTGRKRVTGLSSFVLIIYENTHLIRLYLAYAETELPFTI